MRINGNDDFLLSNLYLSVVSFPESLLDRLLSFTSTMDAANSFDRKDDSI